MFAKGLVLFFSHFSCLILIALLSQLLLGMMMILQGLPRSFLSVQRCVIARGYFVYVKMLA